MSQHLPPPTLARIYGTSAKQIRRWRGENAPLENVEAMAEFLIGRRHQPKGMLAALADQGAAMQSAIDCALGGLPLPVAEGKPGLASDWKERAAENLNDIDAALFCFRCSMLEKWGTMTDAELEGDAKSDAILAILERTKEGVNQLAILTGLELENP